MLLSIVFSLPQMIPATECIALGFDCLGILHVHRESSHATFGQLCCSFVYRFPVFAKLGRNNERYLMGVLFCSGAESTCRCWDLIVFWACADDDNYGIHLLSFDWRRVDRMSR